MEEVRPSMIKFVNQLYRYTQSYTDEAFKEFGLTSGMYPFLLALSRNEGINQNQISRELNIDKAMSARVIRKLIDMDYIRKEGDEKDSRAFRLFLTDKSRRIVPEIKKGINHWVDLITEGLNEKAKEELINNLEFMLSNAKEEKNKKILIGGQNGDGK